MSIGSPEERDALLKRIQVEIDERLAAGETPDPRDWAQMLPEYVEEIETLIELRTFVHEQDGPEADEASAGDAAESDAATDEAILASVESAFQDALNRGDKPDPVVWQARHPDLASEIENIAEIHGFLQDALTADPVAGVIRNKEDEAETALGRYRILQRIADHPIGTAYLGVSDDPPQRVELLVLHPIIERDMGWQILGEADQTRGLQEPGLLPVLEVGEVRGVRFIASRHVEGVSLAQVLLDLAFHGGERNLTHVLPPRGRPVGDEEHEEDLAEARTHASQAAEKLGGGPDHLTRSLKMVASVARIVAQAHLQGRLHRNLSPAAIVIGRDGEPHLRWFGLTKHLPPPRAKKTPVPVWRAPELVLPGEHRVDWHADVWGVGALLFGLLRFEAPLILESGDADRTRLAADGPGRLQRHLDGVVPGARRTLVRALAWDPAARHPTCEALADELEALSRGSLVTETHPLDEPGPRQSWWRGLFGR